MPCMHMCPMLSRAPKELTVKVVLRRVQIPKGFILDPYLSLSTRTRLGVGEEAGVLQGGEAIIRTYYVRKSGFNKRKKILK